MLGKSKKPDWVLPLKMAERLAHKAQYDVALDLLEMIEEELPENSAGWKWTEKQRNAITGRTSSDQPSGKRKHNSHQPPYWNLALDLVNHLRHTGNHDLALEQIGILDSALPSQGAGRDWLELNRAMVLEARDGVSAHRALIEKALSNPVSDVAKSILRLNYIQFLSEVGDLEELQTQIEIQLKQYDNRWVYSRVSEIAERHGIQYKNVTFQSSDIEPIVVLPKRANDIELSRKKNSPNSFHKAPMIGSQFPESHIAQIHHCQLVKIGSRTFFFDKYGKISTHFSDEIPISMGDVLRQILDENNSTDYVDGTSAYLGDTFNTNYCHWLVDCIPRICLFERLGVPFSNIICPSISEPFVNESLAFLGWSSDRVLSLDDRKSLKFESLLVSDTSTKNLRHPMQHCDPLLLQWWREKVPLISEPKGRIYVDRTGKRAVLNKAELTGLLDSYGFETIDPANYSFQQQVDIFANAEVVIGGHGAGLTNILFAPVNCKILELFPPQGGTFAFAALATAIGQDYSYIVSNRTTGRADLNEPNHLSFLAPIAEVNEWLNSL